MGIVCDTSLLITSEKTRFDLASFFMAHPHDEFWIASITASELLHGVERAKEARRRAARKAFVESALEQLAVLPFGLDEAREHARLWATLETKGTIIGPHDLLIAATALRHGYPLATLNRDEFRRVPRLKLLDIIRYVRTPAT